jgi:hypothetical protein
MGLFFKHFNYTYNFIVQGSFLNFKKIVQIILLFKDIFEFFKKSLQIILLFKDLFEFFFKKSESYSPMNDLKRLLSCIIVQLPVAQQVLYNYSTKMDAWRIKVPAYSTMHNSNC